jgi:hypothetical protein
VLQKKIGKQPSTGFYPQSHNLTQNVYWSLLKLYSARTSRDHVHPELLLHQQLCKGLHSTQHTFNLGSTIMRAVLIKNGAGPIENMYIGETETPVPRADEVLVKARAYGFSSRCPAFSFYIELRSRRSVSIEWILYNGMGTIRLQRDHLRF